jgi:hypothetical protein
MPPGGMSVTPAFLLSQPRAGSTLVQRVIAAHPQVATASEPWFLLPLAYSLREEGERAEYWHTLAAQATQDFAAELPGGRAEYLAALGDVARRLYGKASKDGATIFLDKTPHYHFIVGELLEMFPEARFVFLWRNPLAVAASLLRTFRRGRFEPALFEGALFVGVENLVAGLAAAGERGISVRYEDLVTGDAAGWRLVMAHLGLSFDEGQIERFGEVELRGRYGDPGTESREGVLRADPTATWVSFYAGTVRQRWARRYLAFIGADGLAAMGYEREALERQLERAPGRFPGTAVDAWRAARARRVARRRRAVLALPDSPTPVP